MSLARCTLKVQGLDCPVEMKALEAALGGSPGVLALSFDLILGTLTIDYDAETDGPTTFIKRIAERAGMKASLLGTPEVETPSWFVRHARELLTATSGLALLAGVVCSHLGLSSLFEFTLYGVAIAAGGVELFPKGLRGLRQLRLDIHVLMLLAVSGALILGQWDEAATVAFLFGLSELLESLSLGRARRAVRALLEVAPEKADVVEPDGRIRTIEASDVAKGDRVRVRPGDRIPVDGEVVSGRSSVDQKMITGESVPLLREEGDEVFAGTVNGDGPLEIVAKSPLGDALITRLISRVREAQAGKAPVERRIAKFASWYTPLVVIAALGLMLLPPTVLSMSGESANWLAWFSRGLVVLVIACPCALVIATPVAIVSALASAARRGVLIKGGQFLEEIGRLKVIAFDKTGTLTRGEPDVVEIVSEEEGGGEGLLRIAAALGDRGGHVLGRAIARHARELRLDVPQADEYTAFPGLGARGLIDDEPYHIGSHRYLDEAGLCVPGFHDRLDHALESVGTSVALSAKSGPLGWIRLADQARPEAARVVSELNQLGIRTVMLSGDNLLTAAEMAGQLAIKEYHAQLLPAEKVEAVARLDAQYGPTGMIGDGVNDAPALASARVSVAIGGNSSGAAIEAADVVLMADDLSSLPWLIRHSRKTLSRIQQNLILALLTTAIVLTLAVLGLANLWMAIAADVGTSLLVTLNSLRLLRDAD